MDPISEITEVNVEPYQINARDYFIYDQANLQNKCTIISCTHPIIKGNHSGYLKRHLRIHDIVVNDNNSVETNNHNKKKRKNSVNIKLTMPSEEFIKACVEMHLSERKMF